MARCLRSDPRESLDFSGFEGAANAERRAEVRAAFKTFRRLEDLVFLLRDDLAALVHAGLQVDVVRPAQFARVLVFGVGVGPQGIVRTTHVAARRRYFALRNGHVRLSWVRAPPGRVN